jgi:hypothetical protein
LFCEVYCEIKISKRLISFSAPYLAPFSEYKTTVVALTDSGPSDESDPKYATTPHDSPDDAPNNLKIIETTSDSIILNWKPPHKPNRQILYYDILCNDKTYTINATQCSYGCFYKITGLLSYQTYRIQVRACNSKSYCSPYTSDDFSMRTLVSPPSRRDPIDENEAYIIGIIVGGSLVLMIFIIVFYSLVRWMKSNINEYNNLTIILPTGLDVPQIMTDKQFDDNRMNAEFSRSTDSIPNIVNDNPLQKAISDDDSFKNRHGSGLSHTSFSSTEGLIFRSLPNQTNESNAFNRMISSDDRQHESVSSNSYNGEAHINSDSGVEVEAYLNSNELQNVDKVVPKPPLSIFDEMSSRNSDSSGSKDSGLDMNSGGTRAKRKKKRSSKNNKISTFPIRNEVVRDMSSLKTNETNANNGYVPIESILNNGEPISRKLLKNRLEHDWTQSSYDAEVSLTASNGDNEQTDVITQPISSCRNSSSNFSESEKIQNNSLIDIKANGHQFPIESAVHSLITSSKDKSSNLNAIEPMLALNETLSSNSPSHESTKSKTSPNHLPKNSSGYVLHNALTHLSANKTKPKHNLIKKPNGYVVIDANDGFEMRNAFVPNNNIVNHITQV